MRDQRCIIVNESGPVGLYPERATGRCQSGVASRVPSPPLLLRNEVSAAVFRNHRQARRAIRAYLSYRRAMFRVADDDESNYRIFDLVE